LASRVLVALRVPASPPRATAASHTSMQNPTSRPLDDAQRSTYRLFVALACGMILADRSTVVAMAAAAVLADRLRRACWFFSAAVWGADELGLAVARLIVTHLLAGGEAVTVAVDGTFFKRWGPKVFQARWAYDGSAQGGKKVAFGNTWVVAAIVVRLRFCSSPVALPVLFRLWRGSGTASQVQLAAQMLEILAKAFPGRKVHGTGDAAFHGGFGMMTRDGLRKAMILQEVLGPASTYGDFEHGLKAVVNRLREALGDSAENPQFIETLPRRGYRFIAKLEGGVSQSSSVPAASPPTGS